MKIGIITEGVSEYHGLPLLFPQLRSRCGITFANSPLKISVPGDARPAVIAHQCKSRLSLLQASSVDLAIVVLDRERSRTCSGELAGEIEAALSALDHRVPSRVVLKNQSFENWLVADLDAMKAQPARYKVTRAIERQISPNKADSCDAEAIIKRACIKSSYD